MTDKKYDLTYLSFGAGVQSTALLVCSNLGLHGVPRADVAIFADTGYEPQYVYEQLETMRKWSKIPVETVNDGRKGNPEHDLAIPAFTIDASGNRGIVRRICTTAWKVEPITRSVRRHLGYKPGAVVKKKARAMLGISVDEAHRMKPSNHKWQTNTYPLVDARLRRSDCLKIVADAGLPSPERSACYFCPFHSAAEWKRLRDHHPKDWDKAVAYDFAIRNSTRAGLDRPVFLHSQLVPLDQVVLDRPERNLFEAFNSPPNVLALDDEPDAFGNECEGMCGV